MADDTDLPDESATSQDDYGYDDYGFDDFDDYGEDMDDQGADASWNDYGMPQPKKKTKKKKRATGHLDSEDSPKGSSVPPVTFNPNRINIAMLVVGGVLIFFGIQELRLGLKAGSSPQEITFTDLMVDGPGDQVYFRVTDVIPGDRGYVAEEDSYGKLTKVWIPCELNDSRTDSEFVLYSTDVSSETAAESLAVAGTHTGMIINDISGLGSEEKGLLRQSGINPDKAWIFEVGRQPSGFLKYGSMIAGGIVVILLGLAWMLFVHE